MANQDQEFGKKLREHREKKQWTQAKLAREIEVSASYIFYIERGLRAPMQHTIVSLADALRLTSEQRNELLTIRGYKPLPESANAAIRSIEAALTDPEIKGADREGLVRETQAFIHRWRQRRRNRYGEIRKAVIVTAGWQSRLLSPGSLEQVLLHALGEVKKSGLREVIFVMAPGSDSVFAHLRGAVDLTMTRVIQQEPSGLAHALLLAKKQIADEPFALLLPDDIDPSQKVLGEMLRQYKRVHKLLLAVNPELGKKAPFEKRHYCVALLGERQFPQERVFDVKDLKRQPQPSNVDELGSRILVGRYILVPEVFDVLDMPKPNPVTERYELTDGLITLLETETLLAYELAKKLLPLAPVRFVIGKAIKSIKDRDRLAKIVQWTHKLSEKIEGLKDRRA